MKKKIISFSLVTAGFLIGATALTALADWSAPNNAPPTCNGSDPGCLAPINVGPSDGSGSQTKNNSLLINSSLGLAGSFIYGFGTFDINNNPVDVTGYVLTATNSTGKVGWVAPTSGMPSHVVTYTSNATLPAISTARTYRIRVWGGGGGGGSENGGAGGGGGAYTEDVVTVPTNTAVTITVGAGGTGGVSGCNSSQALCVGQSGGQSSFGSYVASGGGGGGLDAQVITNSQVGGGAGGVPVTGSIGLIGTKGQNVYGTSVSWIGGTGGNAAGGGGGGGLSGMSAANGQIPGGGGGGSANINSNGGNGAPGEVVIEY